MMQTLEKALNCFSSSCFPEETQTNPEVKLGDICFVQNTMNMSSDFKSHQINSPLGKEMISILEII